ncbi:MAG: flotillin family protein, partial [Bacteroidota bacterium]
AKGIELKGEAQAEANRKIGRVEAELSIDRGMAEAQITEAQAIADEKAGLAEAKVIEQKALADAKGVEAKAQAMQKLDGVGKEHEEFKLRLEKDKEVELAQIAIQREIAQAQAQVLSEALKSAKIDIVGGETEFFDRITKAVSQSKYVDKIMENQHVADLKTALLGSNGNGDFQGKLRDFIGQFKLSSDDIRNLTVSALIMKMLSQTQDGEKQGILNQLLNTATTLGIADKKADSLGIL